MVLGSETVHAVLRAVTSLWNQTPSNEKNASIFCDAFEFVGAMPPSVRLPRVWADDAEVVFEWIFDGRQAIVSCEGDGVIGYTYRVGGRFFPGKIAAARPSEFPMDLAGYLQ